MRTNKNTSKIIFAISVAVIATMISYSSFKNMHNQLTEQQKLIEVMQKTQASRSDENGSYAYAVATENLKAGEIVADSDVDFKQFDTIDTTAFDNRSDVINKILLKDIQSGDVFTNAHIAKISNDDVTLREGYRALTLPADNFQGRSETMKQGSFVDIYCASSDNSWVLEDVKIISFESIASNPASNPTQNIMIASAITFEVSADDISDFISNVSKSKLVLVARNANDKKVVRKKSNFSSKNNYSMGSIPSLPNIPSSVPIKNLKGTQGSNLSGLPMPIQPEVQQSAVEVIEANVKSKVTFD